MPGDGITHSGIGPPRSTISEENIPLTWLSVSLDRGNSFTGVTSLQMTEACAKLTNGAGFFFFFRLPAPKS